MQAEASFLDRTGVPPTYAVLARVSPGYPPLPGRLPTCYSPVRRSPEAEASFAHDLHVLSTPPAFILSQDQTLQFRPLRLQHRLSAPQALVRNRLQAQRPRRDQAWSQAADFTLFLYLVFKEPTTRRGSPDCGSHRLPPFYPGERHHRPNGFGCQPPAPPLLSLTGCKGR